MLPAYDGHLLDSCKCNHLVIGALLERSLSSRRGRGPSDLKTLGRTGRRSTKPRQQIVATQKEGLNPEATRFYEWNFHNREILKLAIY